MTSETDNYDIVVVGDGIVGKSAALAFAQQHLRVALIIPCSSSISLHPTSDLNSETLQQPNNFEPSEADSRVYAISLSSQKFLHQLKIWQNLPLDKLTPVMNMNVFGDANGKINFSSYQASVPQLCWIVRSIHIENQLTKAIHFHHKIFLISGQTILKSENDDHIFITLDNGKKINAKLLVGADGKNSWIRQQGNFHLSKIDYKQSAIVANFQAEHLHNETANQWFFNTISDANEENSKILPEILAFLPMDNNQISIVWSANKKHANQLMYIPIETFTEKLKTISNNILGNLQEISPRKCFPLFLQKVHKFIDKRTVLIGDAAHVIHPLAGQGLNLGLKDAEILAKIIAKRESFYDCGEQTILRRYQRSRLEEIKKFNLLTDSLQKLFSIEHPLAQLLRNTGMNLISKNSCLKNWLISQAM